MVRRPLASPHADTALRHRCPWLLMPLLLILLTRAQAAAPPPLATPAPTITATDTNAQQAEEKPGLTELVIWSTTLPKRLIDLHNDMLRIVDSRKLEEEQLPGITAEIDTLAWKISQARTNPNLTFDILADLDAELHKVKGNLERMMRPVERAIGLLAGWNREWTGARNRLEQWKQQNSTASISLAADQLEKIGHTIDTATTLVESRLKPALAAAGRIGELQTRAYSMGIELQEQIDEYRATGIQQTSPSMLSSRFYRQLNAQMWEDAGHNLSMLLQQEKKNLASQGWNLALSLASILVLALILSRSRRLTTPTSRWYPFSRRPLATAIFLFLTILDLLIFFFNRPLPPGWSVTVQIIVVLSVIRLTGILVSDPWAKRFLRQLLAFLAITLVLKLIRLPTPLVQLYIFYVSALGAAYLLWQSFHRKKRQKSMAVTWTLRLCALLAAGIFVAELSGYDEMARYVFSSFLLTVVAILVLWMLYVITIGTAELLLGHAPVKILRRNARAMVRQLTPIFGFLSFFLLLLVSLVIWRIYPTPDAAYLGLTSLALQVGSLRISLILVLTAAAIIYGAILVSKWLQTLLRQEILPRYHADIGVQLSITRLVHYAVLLIGFLVLLRVLGFELTKLTILGGALGVGIGFGLQAIVNNFASGLILLFERPIKVGDMIQVGTDLGEVKKLGLRATVVQTLDNAEIVVPNSDLITGQVTNWTLAERRVRVKVPVGVAYGTDIARVLEILLACAEANPLVLTEPRARALFLAFGPSSLDFELRVWISDFTDRRQVLSELNQDIESEFRAAGIEIPFPQQDIHLRSIDEPARRALRGSEQEGEAETIASRPRPRRQAG